MEQQQEQPQQQGDLGGFRKLERDRHEGDHNNVKETAGNSSENNVVREEDSFQADLRVHGVSQDVIYNDQEVMTQIQTLVDKLQDGYRTKSIINDLEKKGISSMFSKASRRTIKGKVELYELGEISKTDQCQSCLRYFKEATVDCLCGICLMPSLEQTEKIKNRIDNKSSPL